MKKKNLNGLSLNKKTISNLNELNGGLAPRGSWGCGTNQTCIGSPDPNCGLGSDACNTWQYQLCDTNPNN